MRERPLLLGACVFLAGLVYNNYHRIEPLLLLAFWILYEGYCGIRTNRMKIMAKRSLLLLFAFILGCMRMNSVIEFRESYMSKMEDGAVVTVWGEVSKVEDTDYGGGRLMLTDCYIRISSEVVPCNDVMVYTSSNRFSVGEIHKITGEFHNFSQARNEGAFDSFTYYRSQKIDYCVYMDTGQLLESDGNVFASWLLAIREEIRAVYDIHTSARTAGFLASMVLGDRSGLEGDLKELFTNGGIAHILAISGLHISIIGRGLYGFLRRRSWSFCLAGVVAGVVLLLYGNMVGNGMSAIRAIGMMLLFFSGQALGRGYDMLNALGAMVLYLLWENPYLMEYSGFWFSVLALVGIGYVGEALSGLKKGGSGFLSSIGITLTTLPVVACCYYEIPVYSPLVNMLLLPLLTPIFLLALVGGLVGLLLPGPASILLLPCEWGLGFYEWVCGLVEQLPFSLLLCGAPKPGIVAGYYVLLFGGVAIMKRCTHPRRTASIVSALCVTLLIWPTPQIPRICFLDVGQGDGIYIATGDGTHYFIDGGSTDEKNLGKYCLLPFLKSNGISGIDYWFVSHADKDHISGLVEVMEQGYEVKNLVISSEAPMDENMAALLEAALRNKTTVQYMKAGDCIQTSHTKIRCVYPFPQMDEDYPKLQEDRNNMSMVLEYEAENMGSDTFYALFGGDISTEVEQLLLEKKSLHDITLYKAAHHGSRYSNGEMLLQQILPEYAVVSCGADNRYGHPSKDAVARMKQVGAVLYYTMDGGQITISVKKEEIIIDSYKKGTSPESHDLVQ